MLSADSSSARHLAALLEVHTGQQLAANRMWRVETVLKSMMRERELATLDDLVTRLMSGKDPALAEMVVEALLNNETFFYRDHAVFQLLEAGGLEQLRLARAKEKRLRIWSVGCSTGQEAYSLAMIFADAPTKWADWSIDISATDVSAGAIKRAKDGSFSQFEIQRGLPMMKMIRWFEQEGETWRVKRDLARRIRFKRQSLLEGQPIPGRFDVILCRNVLLYFSADRRRDSFSRLADAIAPDGYLLLGAGETVIGQTDDFASDRELRGLYRPVAAIARTQAA